MTKRWRTRSALFRPEDLVLVSPAPPPDNPPLGVGDYCMLNSGGPKMLVVDVEEEHVTTAWGREREEEHRFLRAIVRRTA